MSKNNLIRWPENTQDHADFAKKFLKYNPETGDLIWIVDKGRRNSGDIAGNKMPNGYFQIVLAQKNFKAHRICWLIHYGCWPSGHIDHINGNPSDNRISNLRNVTQLENCRNAKLRTDNLSGVVGVSWSKASQKWTARIKLGPNLKYKHLGVFDKIEDAIAARSDAEKAIGFHENHGRKIIR